MGTERTFSPNRYDENPGAREFVPDSRKKYWTYEGRVIDAFVPNVAVEPIFSINTKPWGKREPVDFAVGQQGEAEIKLVMDYWSLDKLEGQRIIICPTNNRDRELLHTLIEGAYVVEGVVNDVKQKVVEAKSLVKALLHLV